MNVFDKRVGVHRGYKFLEVRIDGIPHLLLDHERLTGFQSWEEGHPATGFAIEFTMVGSEPIVARYNIKALWETIIGKTADCLQARQFEPSAKKAEVKPDA